MNIKGLLVILACLSLSVSGCSSTLQKDSNAKAHLDYENSQISTPVLEYAESSIDRSAETKARDILLSKCFRDNGGEYKIPTGKTTISSTSRDYGVWSVDYTKKYGLHEPETFVPVQNDYGILDKCLKLVKPQVENIGGVVDAQKAKRPTIIRERAYRAAMSDSEWKTNREAWWTCLESKGLSPRKGENEWGTEESLSAYTRKSPSDPASEEEIRVLTIEAQCNEDTGMARNLANLEAAYQMPLIREHQTELNDLKEQIKARTEKFQRFIAENQ
ncbi:MAG: hypothetical protein Q4P78_00605 [Rothia sp. (in: high G+C Gram-positive bacteria)]|uniref:hypothetical protein n=1 Tax=Rothia sp. (in: high G+C Gram-positive bacteria) TaxID=1885016 RepID=UPI0026DFDABC|nr:hypothetical protein [Rothia sp. (in: high G+C Gram-positive bacteria)]MDO5749690.1 hypothetical protein [Rothia sp. (in: high G+C Gram-positive bacteria)]